VKYSPEALAAAVKYSVRYINDRFLPDKAIDLMDEAGAMVQMSSWENDGVDSSKVRPTAVAYTGSHALTHHAFRLHRGPERVFIRSRRPAHLRQEVRTVEEHHVAEVVAQWTGIPMQKLTTDATGMLTGLGAALAARVIGQGEATRAITKAVWRARTGLRNPARPIASLFFR
jgi:ATP-dependent Clp protease ATP-binding subunit ClpA